MMTLKLDNALLQLGSPSFEGQQVKVLPCDLCFKSHTRVIAVKVEGYLVWEIHSPCLDRLAKLKEMLLKPEEKLFNATFGRSLAREQPFLEADGCQAVRDMLKLFAEKHNGKGEHRYLRVIQLRFGFEPRTADEKPGQSDSRTLLEVSKYFGLTRERIRQMEAKTLRSLRHPLYSGRLRVWLEKNKSKGG